MYDVFREALPGQIARGLRANASARDDPRRALALTLERHQRVLDEIGVDTRAHQVVTDQGIACASIGEPFGARLREAAIIDEASAHERREGFDSLVLGYAPRRELIVDLRSAAIALAQGAKRRLDGVAGPARRPFSSRREPPLRARPRRRSPWAPGPGGAAQR